MPFWDAQRNAPLAPPVLAAVWALHSYAALSGGYVVWMALTIGFNPDEAVLAGIRLACAEGIAWGLRRRQSWALWLGLAGGVFGGLGLVGAALAISHAGVSGLPLGVVTAAYSIASAVCLALSGLLLARRDSRAVFGAPAGGPPPAA